MMNLTPRVNRLERNIVIDGGMEIWPEGASRTVANNSSAYGAILFKLNNTASGITLTNSLQTSVPSAELQYSNQVSKTAAGTLAAGTFTILNYNIEGCDIQNLIKNDFSVIFWVKSSVASSRSLSVKNATSSHSLVQQYQISQANTWELKALKIPALQSCPGTLDRTNGVGLNIGFNIVSGSTFQTSTLNAWVAGNFISGIGEDTSWLTGTTHDFSIAGVMVLLGDWTELTPAGYQFVRASGSGTDRELTFKYWQSTYDGPNGLPNATPRGNVGNGTGEIQARWGTAPSSSDELYAAMPLKAQMRALPTVELWSTAGAQNNFQRDGGGAILAQLWNAGRNFHQIVATNSQASNTAVHRIHIIADARF